MTQAIEARSLRSCFGQFATGVTVVTYALDGEHRGATVNSFTSVSLDPPLLLVSLARASRACSAMPGARFAVNVLAEDQLAIALHFAGRTQSNLVIPWEDGDTPRLRDSIAWFECSPWAEYDGGDHRMFVGRIERHGSRRAKPLAFHSGDFRALGLALFELPQIVPLDGRPIADWIGPAHRLHEISENSPDY